MAKRAGTVVPILGVLAALMALLAISCGGPAATPTPTATATPTAVGPVATPTPTGVAPVATPTPTAAPPPEVKPRYGGIINTAHRRTPPDFDMRDQSTIDVLGTVPPAYSGLFKTKSPYFLELEPDLVTKWEFSADAKTLTLQIHKGVVDHQGNPFTAEDVEYCIETLAAGDLKMSFYFEDIVTDVEVVDDRTVRVHLAAPNASLLMKMAQAAGMMYTKKAAESNDLSRTAVGTGPYRLTEYLAGEKLAYRKFDQFFKEGLPYLDGVNIYAIKDTSARLAAFEAKRLDVVLMGSSHGFTVKRVKAVAERHPGQIGYTVGTHTIGRGIHFNLKRKGPWQDFRVRKAIHLAIDRQAAVDSMIVAKLGSFILPGKWSRPIDEILTWPGWRQPKDEDIAEAKRLMAEAGYPDGFSVEALCRDTTDYRDYHCPFMAHELRKLGIEATIDVEETGRWLERHVAKDLDIEFGSQGGGRFDDPDLIMSDWTCGSPENYSQWCNEEYDALYRQQSAELDPEKRKELVWQMEDIIREELPTTMVWWAARVPIWWNYVMNVPIEEKSGQYSSARRFEDVWLAERY